jgi:hypothetical protein
MKPQKPNTPNERPGFDQTKQGKPHGTDNPMKHGQKHGDKHGTDFKTQPDRSGKKPNC